MRFCLFFHLVCLICAPCAYAVESITVAQALVADNESQCCLDGRILEKLRSRKHRYVFADNSARMVVYVPKKVFEDIVVTPDNRVRLCGLVRADAKYPNELKAVSLTLLPNP